MANTGHDRSDSKAYKPEMETDRLKCGVCLERFDHPKLLPCFHTFCLKCIERLAAGKHSFLCPSCRTDVIIPQEGASQLQNNFYLECDLAKAGAEQKLKCELCSEGKQPKTKCIECQQVFCPSCKEMHDAIQSCARHASVPLTTDAAAIDAAVFEDKKCPKHKKASLDLYCVKCQVPICVQCKLTSHTSHDTEDLVDEGEKARSQLTEELQTLVRKEKVLDSLLAKAQDFQTDLAREKDSLENAISERAIQLESLVEQAKKEATDTVYQANEKEAEKLAQQSLRLKQRLEFLAAKREFITQILDRSSDVDAVAFVVERSQDEKALDSKTTRKHEPLIVEKTSLQHNFKARAIRYAAVLSYVGIAAEGCFFQSKACRDDAETLQETVSKPSLLKTGYSSLRLREHGHQLQSTFTQFNYSRKENATLQGMCLTTEDGLWLVLNPDCNVTFMALFDDQGNHEETIFDDYLENPLVTTTDNTTVSLADGKWVRPGNERGKLQASPGYNGCKVSKSSPLYVLRETITTQGTRHTRNNQQYQPPPQPTQEITLDIYPFSSMETIPPAIEKTAICKVNYNKNCYSDIINFDVSEDGKFFAFCYNNVVAVYDQIPTTSTMRNFATYSVTNMASTDVCFCVVDGEERLLVAYQAKHTVHVVDYTDGCSFVRTLENEQCKLKFPKLLATNHNGCVWVGCDGGKVFVFDV